MPITYPRPCPKCGTKIKNKGNFSRHKKCCGTSEHRVQCLQCPKTYSRKDDMLKHVRKFHSELAKGQTGGAVSTRGMKKDVERTKIDPKPVKDEPRAVKRKLEDDVDMSHLLDDGLDDFLVERANRLELSENPLFKANRTFLPYKRQGLKGAVKKEQFTVTFDQLRKPTGEESLGEGLSESLIEAVRTQS